MRSESGIMVSVLDMSGVEEEAKNFYIDEQQREFKYTPEVNMKVMGKWGVIPTTIGYFALNSLGKGQVEPVNRFGSDLSVSFYHYNEGVAIVGPLVSRPFTLDILTKSQVIDEVPLEDFIESCLPVCERNYQIWRDMFSKSYSEYETNVVDEEDEGVKDDVIENRKKICPTLFTTKQLAKYGKFLVKTKCDCTDAVPLVNVTKSICSCGNKKEHSHCSKCGGVL